MATSIATRKRPVKRRPIDRFPDRPRADGRFAKRILGKLYYFGSHGDRDEAIAEYDLVKHAYAGRVPEARVTPSGSATVKYAFDLYLDHCRKRTIALDLGRSHFADYLVALREFATCVGKHSPIDVLRPDDFERARAAWSKRMGPWALDLKVQAVRTAMRWALKHRLIDREPWYGDEFAKTSPVEKRQVERQQMRERGPSLFLPEELRLIVPACVRPDGQLEAMVLLALNGGMYSADIANLRVSDRQTEKGHQVIDLDRRKTGVMWRFVLWPETIEAIDEVLTKRRKPASDEFADHLFLTVRGRPWVREPAIGEDARIGKYATSNAISQEFDKVLRVVQIERRGVDVPIKRAGIGFGRLRLTHVTATGDHSDRNAARRSRGHVIEGIESHYDKIGIERLKAVSDWRGNVWF